MNFHSYFVANGTSTFKSIEGVVKNPLPAAVVEGQRWPNSSAA